MKKSEGKDFQSDYLPLPLVIAKECVLVSQRCPEEVGAGCFESDQLSTRPAQALLTLNSAGLFSSRSYRFCVFRVCVVLVL